MTRLISQTEFDAPVDLVGGKSRGLLRLKTIEEKLISSVTNYSMTIPPFFVIPPTVDLHQNYYYIVETARKLGSERYAVRSSSPLEDIGEHSFDGIFETELKVPLDKIVRTILKVRKSSMSKKAQAYAQDIGVTLYKKIPVMVQSMVENPHYTGMVYSKFPSPNNIVKVIRDATHDKDRFIDAFEREEYDNGRIIYAGRIVIASPTYSPYTKDAQHLAELALKIEQEFQHPIIMEFAYRANHSSEGPSIYISLLQARKLTNLAEAIKFQMPELQEKGLLANTYEVNSSGDVTGKAFVAHGTTFGIEAEGIVEFDESHKQEGYILVTPFIQFYNSEIDSATPHKKAVIVYTDLGEHHDFEIARKKGLLYLNCYESLKHLFPYGGAAILREVPIKTGETVRVMSDGEKGFVFNLSRN